MTPDTPALASPAEIDALIDVVIKKIWAELERLTWGIGYEVSAAARKKAMEQKIRAHGDFINAIDPVVTVGTDQITLRVGSNVKHEPFVLGGKVPSWTPLEPLEDWVRVKALAWTDKKTGDAMTVEEMAKLIQLKIHAKGIPARNVFAEVLTEMRPHIITSFSNMRISA